MPLDKLHTRDHELLRRFLGSSGGDLDRRRAGSSVGWLREIPKQNLFQIHGARPAVRQTKAQQNFYAGADAGSNPNPWTHYSFDVSSLVAAGGTYQVRFAMTDNQYFFNMGVDNVSVMASPEPGTLLLLAPALGALLLKRRRLIA